MREVFCAGAEFLPLQHRLPALHQFRRLVAQLLADAPHFIEQLLGIVWRHLVHGFKAPRRRSAKRIDPRGALKPAGQLKGEGSACGPCKTVG
jgi:hypothetical protein